MPEESVNLEGNMGELVEMPKKKFKQELSASQKFWLLRMIFSEWLDKLTPSEFMVVMFIWQRTILWGKGREFIKFRHFLKGIDGEIRPLPLKQRRLQQILKSLVQKGVIERRTRVYGSWYNINYEWKPGRTARRRVKKKPQSERAHKSAKQVQENA